MALADYIPVVFFGTAAALLQMDLYNKMRKDAFALFILFFLCSIGMGAMSGQDSTLAIVNWIEQGINCIGQGLLMCSVLILHKTGLKNFTF